MPKHKYLRSGEALKQARQLERCEHWLPHVILSLLSHSSSSGLEDNVRDLASVQRTRAPSTPPHPQKSHDEDGAI
jgi:hypothetical protein